MRGLCCALAHDVTSGAPCSAGSIDHCSRFVPESRYGLVEDQMHVRRGLRALCTRVGPPHKLYVDGGPGYQGAQFGFGCWPAPS